MKWCNSGNSLIHFLTFHNHLTFLERKKLKRLIIPLLLVLKIFKLKLLLFLPFILGIAGLKKILGLAAIILPGLFAYLKFCRPTGSNFSGGLFSDIFGLNHKNSFLEYSPQGVGPATFQQHYGHHPQSSFNRPNPYFSKPYTDYYTKHEETEGFNGNTVSFGHDGSNHPYSGHYYGRNAQIKDIPAEESKNWADESSSSPFSPFPALCRVGSHPINHTIPNSPSPLPTLLRSSPLVLSSSIIFIPHPAQPGHSCSFHVCPWITPPTELRD